MVGDVGDPALQALHGPQNFLKSRYSPRFLVWAMENETVKSLGVPLGHALSSATKFVDLSQKSTGFDARGKENFFRGSGRGSGRCSALTDYHLALRFHLQRFHQFQERVFRVSFAVALDIEV